MAENTRQYEAIVALKGNIEAFAPADTFVAGDHLIYVDPRDPAVRQAPDVYVAFGRPRGHRGSYKVWEEGNVFPQVVFEVLGPSNTAAEMRGKRRFYFAHGAEEYYEFDPEAGTWLGFVLDADTGLPRQIPNMDAYTSPRLGMRFAFRPMELLVFRPDGTRFLSFQEMNDALAAARERADDAKRQADDAKRQADDAKRQADDAKRQADDAKRDNDRLRAMFRAAGLDPDAQPG